ncbi:MAG: SIS domain-containing protein [Candidatus Eisenbacteria bacterium]|nr:SIS domain-containing protein [Candidatus Latescibacterota bacterium]MBD3301786.1 SIS domain-containing protein [Candidatus Eisenbacteria bacterium]
MIDESDIRSRIEECVRVQKALLGETALLREIAGIWIESLRRGGKILFFGNGGSAADAQHLACELSGRFYKDRAGLAAVALTVNTSSLTAIGNDFGYDAVFARQLEGLGKPEDVAVGISTSGRSESVLAGLRRAREIGMRRCGFTGRRGGALPDLVDLCLRVDSEETPRIQEGHILAGHVICELVEREMFP